VSGRRFTYDECGKTIVRGTMDAGINNVIYMELYSGPKMANDFYIYIYIKIQHCVVRSHLLQPQITQEPNMQNT